MRIKIKKSSAVRLASLSALGAGALGVGAGVAHAGIIYTPLSGHVGFTPEGVSPAGATTFTTNVGGGLRSFLVGRGSNTATHQTNSGYVRTYKYWVSLIGHSLAFKAADAVLGQTWLKLGGGAITKMQLGARTSVFTYHTRSDHGGDPFSGTIGTFYKLFEFKPGATDLYGWIQFNQSISDGKDNGPEVDILGMAYDDSGNPIPAGDTSPEPSSAALAGLGALALGAAGLRRWRAARTVKPAA